MSRLRRATAWLTGGHRFTALCMAALCLYYAFTWGAFQAKAAGDGWFAFLYLKAIFYFHTLDMRVVAPEYLRFFGEWGPGKHMPNRCPFGPVFIWMPFYLLVAVPEWILLKLHLIKQTPGCGQMPIHVWVTGLSSLGSVLLGWRALLKLYLRHLGVWSSQLGAAVAVLATPMLWYTAHHPFYQHAIAFMVVSVLIEYWDRTLGQTRILRFVIMGALAGYGMSVRAQEVVWVLPIAAEITWRVCTGPNRGRWLLGALVCVIAATIALSPQLAVWYYYSGKIAPVQAEPLRWKDPFFLVALFSSRAGLFPWTPITYASVVGLVLLVRDRLRKGAISRATGLLTLGIFAAFMANLYIVASAWMVASGFAFGSRRLSDGVMLIGLGIALLDQLWATSTRRRNIVIAICGIAVVFNLVLCELLRLQKMPSSGSNTRSLAGVMKYELHMGPRLVRVAEIVGYPFVQPVGWLWSWYYHVSEATYEIVVGTFFLDRDGQWMTVLTKGLELNGANRYYVASGLRWPDEQHPAEVIGPVRMLLPMFARETFDLDIFGKFGAGEKALHWNGKLVPLEGKEDHLHALVPLGVVIAGTNDVVLDLPAGSLLGRLAFNPKGRVP